MKSRRDFLRISALLGAGLTVMGRKSFAHDHTSSLSVEPPPFSLPGLPYEKAALEPHIDALTMEIHHDKHHQAYVNNLNKAVEAMGKVPSLEDLCRTVSKQTPAVRNNAGGHYNHSIFWTLMRPASVSGTNAPTGKLAEAITSTFGSVDAFKEAFAKVAKERFGSGWAWLVVQDKKLVIGSTPNQDNPLMDISDLKGTPILALDVWEHAYYLHYQNRRPDYITAWWNIVNWEKVAELFDKA
jgi:Fe-Mn family superoxide dismutase